MSIIPLAILIVEDSEDDALLIVAALDSAGYGVFSTRVETAAQMRAALADRAWDLVISDYNLPQFNGRAALTLLQETGQDIPFIIVSGVIGEETAVAMMKAGAHDYLLKDRLTRLGPAVERVLDQKRLRVQQRSAERQLRDSELRHRALIENSADAITLLTADGIVLYTSPATDRILGSLPGGWLQRNWLERVHAEDLPLMTQIFGQLALTPGARVSATLRYRHLDGSWRWLEATGSNLPDEHGERAVVLNYRDITRRKRAEDAVAESEAELRALFAAMSDIVVVMDPAGRFLQVAPTNPATLYKPSAELVGKTLHDVLPAAEANNILRAIPRALQEQRPMPIEYCIAIGDATVWFDGTVSPMGAGKVIWIARDVTEHKRAAEQIQQQLQHLAALRSIDVAISSSLDLHVTLSVLLEQVVEQLHVDATTVLLLNPYSLELEFAAGRGFRSRLVERARLRLGDKIAGTVALERTLIAIPELSVTQLPPALKELLRLEDFVSYIGCPLIAKGQVKGILEVWQRKRLEPDAEWLNFFEALAGQTAIAIENVQLFDGLQRSNTELSLAYDTTIEGWSRALDLRDKETEGHTQRVTELTVRLARAMGLPEDQLIHVRRGALLHDIGKMGVPDSILLKPGPLTEDEWAMMKRHPGMAHDLLSPIDFLQPALDIPYCHHEKWDGSGYPRGLMGEHIPLTARAFAVVDVWDALRSDRPYRKAWTEDRVREYIRGLAGTHFDPRVVEAFWRVVIEET